MLRSFVQAMLGGRRRHLARRHSLPARFAPGFEPLETRLAPAITATFAPGTGVLLVIGDSQDNTIVVSREADGQILVNDGEVAIKGGPANVGNTVEVRILGLSGDDHLALDETNGEMPVVHLLGGSGDDNLQGGSRADFLSGGSGNDLLRGGPGDDLMFGQDGDDTVSGEEGDDQAFLGSGDDLFVRDGGDGNDTIEGEGGRDRLLFNGSVGSETIDILADEGRVQFTADGVMDLVGVEQFDLNALGGADAITVNDLTGTGVTDVNINLSALIRFDAPDNQADAVTVHGSAGDDVATVAASGRLITISGLPATVRVRNAEADRDRLSVNGLGGDDVIDASGLAAGVVLFSADGGDGDDQVLGSAGSDSLTGGSGDDFVQAGDGDDSVSGGAGDDVILGDAGNDLLDGGDGADVIDAGDGNDTLIGGPGDDILEDGPGDDLIVP